METAATHAFQDAGPFRAPEEAVSTIDQTENELAIYTGDSLPMWLAGGVLRTYGVGRDLDFCRWPLAARFPGIYDPGPPKPAVAPDEVQRSVAI